MSEDLISREKAYKVLSEYYHHKTEMQHKALQEALDRVPSAESEEFEWCTGCKEYDQEAHCCHRWTKVIRKTVEELKSAQPERKKGKWLEREVIHAKEAKSIITEWQSCKCSVCGCYDTRPYLYCFNEPRFCSWCGADLRERRTDEAD